MGYHHLSADSSSPSSSDDESKTWKSDKKDTNHNFNAEGHIGGNSTMIAPSLPIPHFPEVQHFREGEVPPAYTPRPSAIPPSGYRIPLDTKDPFPTDAAQTRYPPFFDADGSSPVYFGSALFPRSVHPCKIAPRIQPPCRVPYGGGEYEHRGRYDLLPFTPETMVLVKTSHGKIPEGRRPVEGGYEEGGNKLYHAVAEVQGVRIPGKTGEHLGGCNVAFGGGEHIIGENYDILQVSFPPI
ncbi:hypothetical protein EW146_g660 [Bondarzewia mesenterica]|uniref:Uncharacterized protein n=1 Tax=Bondarzewia mesenterica TaxID=1095465 RepID=A0A4S4MCF0_9AGAM|nr:hypothetical protein EW146_g660 [Bondarzewia mesenterica]